MEGFRVTKYIPVDSVNALCATYSLEFFNSVFAYSFDYDSSYGGLSKFKRSGNILTIFQDGRVIQTLRKVVQTSLKCVVPDESVKDIILKDEGLNLFYLYDPSLVIVNNMFVTGIKREGDDLIQHKFSMETGEDLGALKIKNNYRDQYYGGSFTAVQGIYHLLSSVTIKLFNSY